MEKQPLSFTDNVVAQREEQDDFILLREENRKAAERHVVRKLDMRLIPTVVVISWMNYIDRVAVTAARLQGLEHDLGLTDVEYQTVIAVFFASYAPAQILSNMILGYISRPSFYLAACVAAWGLASAMTGVTKNFVGIVTCRIFIGLPEAAFFPGLIYLLSRWYTKEELALRSATLSVAQSASNAFGSFIAAGVLAKMQGILGISAWRWLFFIEGAITIIIGLSSAWFLPDLPHNTRWLSPAERRLLQARMAEDVGEADQDSSEATIYYGFKLAIRDVKIWVFMLMNCLQGLGTSFGNFFPTLTATLGYNTTDTLLMAAPPWILTAICCIVTTWHSDRTGERYFHLTGWWWVSITGLIICLGTTSTGGRYFSLFLMVIGGSGGPLGLNWLSNVVSRPPAKRSVAIALANAASFIGTLGGSYVWKAKWGPKYHQSIVISICSLVLAVASGFFLRRMLIHENKRMEQEEQILTEVQRERVAEAARLGGITFEEAIHRRKAFRYLV